MTCVAIPVLRDPPVATDSQFAGLRRRYLAVRAVTEELCEPLEPDDLLLQSMPDASPVKWHLAHTTWFFENFVLARAIPGYRPFHPQFNFLFNSYYNAAGPRWPRPERALLSRPTVEEVFQYRIYVDERMLHLLESDRLDPADPFIETIILGLNHEQQHQELILTDLKHPWSLNPLRPVYSAPLPEVEAAQSPPTGWLAIEAGLATIGHGGNGFAFDNETPQHRTWLAGCRIAKRLVTCGEYLAFMADRGYQRPEFWLSDGWLVREERQWSAPLYWQQEGPDWWTFTLNGYRPVNPAEPICHVSYYEADAFARWAGARLPTEAEWEVAAESSDLTGHFAEAGRFSPASAPVEGDRGPLVQLYGDVWQWTASPYLGYPGYQPTAGALGEYNGKFMCNQLVLRGASCATPHSHARRTYRNFFPADARWQFSGVRLAEDLR